MKLSLRQQEILGMARQKGYLSTEELARILEVTTQTIRRDINLLCESGVMRRYHGGVGLALSTENVDYLSRQVLNQEAKTRIARMVAGQIPDSASLLVDTYDVLKSGVPNAITVFKELQAVAPEKAAAMFERRLKPTNKVIAEKKVPPYLRTALRKRGLNLQAVYKTIQKSGLTADVKKQALHQFAAWDEAFQVALRTAIREL